MPDNEHNNEQQTQREDARLSLPPGWRLALKLEPDGSGELGGAAELWEHEALRCRLVLTRYGQDRDAALARVHARVGYWMSEWLARPHSGDTNFSELE